MELTQTFSGVKCDLCNFVWLASFTRKLPETLECPRCKQTVEYTVVSLDDFQNKTDEPG